jgi:hypothetical protein
MPTAARNVRFRGQSGKRLLTLSFSGFAKRTSTVPSNSVLDAGLSAINAFVFADKMPSS